MRTPSVEALYNLDGSRRQRITTTTKVWGNVDVRQRVQIGTRTLDVVAALNGGLRLYTVNPTTVMLTPIVDNATGLITTNGGGGVCLYDSASTGNVFAFVVTKAGRVRQYQLTDADSDGRLLATKVREFTLSGSAEACVADDETGALYLAEEQTALWRYGAEPSSGTTRTRVDSVTPAQQVIADHGQATSAMGRMADHDLDVRAHRDPITRLR